MRATLTLCAMIVALTACGSSDDTEAPSDETTAPAAATPTEPAPVPEPEPEPAAPDLTATAIAVPLHELEDREPLEAALRAGGWEIGSSSATRSAMFAITTHATKGGVEAVIHYYHHGGDFWRRRLEQDGAAIHADDEHEILLGVTIESNRDAQQPLLDSLLPANDAE